MANRETKVVFAVPTFQSSILIAVSDHLKKLFKQEEIVVRSMTGESAAQKDHLKRGTYTSKTHCLNCNGYRS